MDATVQAIIDAVEAIGPLGLLVLAIYAAYKRWVVFGAEHAEMKADRDLWRNMALEHLQLANRAADAAEKAVGVRNDAPA